jgi:hypothetical protein
LKNQDLFINIILTSKPRTAIGNARIKEFPIKAQIMARNRPGKVFGVKSPYPTVVIVAITSQIESVIVLLLKKM